MKNLDWTLEFQNLHEEWKIETMKNALSELDNPHLKLKNVIHIAGTNGKGSTASFIRTILECSGYKVGLFTSPHLVEYNERFYCDNNLITDDEIEHFKHQIVKKCSNAKQLSFFEMTTLIAILWFAKKQPDYCIFEVGLGGRLDATNVFDNPLVSVIASISFDHMDKLGNTLTDIAMEKAGIIKQNVPVFTSNTNEEVLDEIKRIAEAKHSNVFCAGVDYKIDETLKPSLLGGHQIENASLAKAVCKYIGIDDTTIHEGIATTKWVGRIEKIDFASLLKHNDVIARYKQFNVETFLDGAHNEDGIRVLCDFINSQENEGTNIIGIFACLERKKYESFFPILSKTAFDKILFFNVPKGVNDFTSTTTLGQLATKYKIKNGAISDFNEVIEYLDEEKENKIFIFGSLYFIGWVKSIINNK